MCSSDLGLSVLHSASSRAAVKKAPPDCAAAGSIIASAKAQQEAIKLFTREPASAPLVNAGNPSLSWRLCQAGGGDQVNMSSRVLDMWEAALNTARLARKLCTAWVILTSLVARSTLGIATWPCTLAKGDPGS